MANKVRDIATDPQAASDAMKQSWADMVRMREEGCSWSEIRESVEGRDDWYAVHMRSHVQVFEAAENKVIKRLLRLSLLLERDLVP